MLRRSIHLITLALMAVFQVASVIDTARAVSLPAAGPTVDKTTIMIRANTKSNWDYKVNAAKWGWAPEIDFRVNGPVPSGSAISVGLSTPDGKPWLTVDCKTSTVTAGEVLTIERCGLDLSKKATNLTPTIGSFGLKIRLTNELQGLDQDLFNGKFKVSKVFYGDVPQDKDNYLWYVDYDWALPVAEVYADAYEKMYGQVRLKDAQPLVATFWFRGSAANAVAYLFYKGQQIGSTETTSDGIAVGEQGVELWEKPGVPIAWVKNQYHFTHVLVTNREKNSSHMDAFRMDKNPGEYEIKVLRKGKLARAVKFTVGADGRIVDPGISRENELGTGRITLFATVAGDEDGRKPDLIAWKSSAFFCQPLKGFGN